MRTQQRKQTTILYTILTLSILLAASSLIYAIYSNQQLTEQASDLEYTTTLTNTRINQLELDIADLSLQADSDILETETKVETESTDDTATNTKPVEQKESKPAKETPATKPATTETKPKESTQSTSNPSIETYTVTSVTVGSDGVNVYESKSNDTSDGYLDFTQEALPNDTSIKKGDQITVEYDEEGVMTEMYKSN